MSQQSHLFINKRWYSGLHLLSHEFWDSEKWLPWIVLLLFSLRYDYQFYASNPPQHSLLSVTLTQSLKGSCLQIRKINCRIEKKNNWMRLESRMEVQFSTFSANRCDWISISCSETHWTYWLFCMFRTSNTHLRISLLKQKCIMS